MLEPDPDTQRTITIKYNVSQPCVVSVCLIGGISHKLDNETQEWKPCWRHTYDAIALECLGSPSH